MTKGPTVCVMASGPSMNQQDADRVRAWRDSGTGRAAIAINNTYQLAPWSDHIYACDKRWWDKYHADVFKRCTGTFWTYYQLTADTYGIRRAEIPAKKTGGNSGTQCCRLAISELNASRIILLGFDMKGGHWHPQHSLNGSGWHDPDQSLFRQWIQHMGRLAREFPEVEFINASRETAIPDVLIQRQPLERALC